MKLVAAFLVASLALVATIPLGCEDGGDSTTGRRVTLSLRARGSAGATTPFTNEKGYRVTLSKALLATGGFTYFEGATIFSRLAPRRGSGFVRTAFAHPGHYVPGAARGEMLTPSSIDLRGDAVLGSGPGTTGLVRSATFAFGDGTAGPAAAGLGGKSVLVEGTAEKDGVVRAFRAELAGDELRNAKGTLDIEGCPFAETDIQSDGEVLLTVAVEPWFATVEFAEVPPGTTPTSLVAGGLARNQLSRGAKAGTPYSFSFSPANR